MNKNRIVVYGPPGTGKTSKLISLIKEFKNKGYSEDRIGLTSFTKAGAKELATRADINTQWAGTIHSFAYQLCGINKSQVLNYDAIRKFAKLIKIPISGRDPTDNERLEVGDEYLALYNLAQATIDGLSYTYLCSDKPGTYVEYRRFCKGMLTYKEKNGYIDFNDMLAMAKSAPAPNVDVLFIDEAQDLSKLQWSLIEHWCKSINNVVIAADDDQCQIAGTSVLTPNGEVPIEHLANGEHVISCDIHGGYFLPRTIKITSRPYNGNLVCVKTSNKQSRYTPNHRCIVKYGTKYLKIYACNLDPKLHQLCETDGNEMNWLDFEISTEHYEGEVYSLDVDKTANYIADGILTHNSLYVWSGASPNYIEHWEKENNAKRIILDQSYRVPVSAHRLAESLINKVKKRVKKEYKPRDFRGSIRSTMSVSMIKFKHGEDCLVLYRNHSLRREIEDRLQLMGIPYLIDSGSIGPLQNRVVSYIKMWQTVVNNNKLDSINVEKFAQSVRPQYTSMVCEEYLSNIVHMKWYEILNPIAFRMSVDAWRYLKYIEGKYGINVKPTIHLSTIHGAKGREAERVILLNDMNYKTYKQHLVDIDAERRVFYVAITRTKNILEVINGDKPIQL